MSFEPSGEAFVWIWLPGAREPVVTGRIDEAGGEATFVYGRSYLERPDSISLYTPELPLIEERLRPLQGLDAPGCILDARPDAWGQRVIMNRLVGSGATDADPADLSLITLLIESGSDRAGAIDFQSSSDHYVARGRENASLDELASSAQRVEEGIPLSDELDAALLHGSSIGGARPKALIDDGPRRLIAKFSSSSDTFPVEQGEYVAMELAHRAGLNVARTELTQALDKRALLVERFDRIPETKERRSFVSALTMLGLNELAARHASYADLAQIMRSTFLDPGSNLRELFSRITFNILVGNTDDHARNHAAFWDGDSLELTPAYDICPQVRNTGRATQAMIIGDGTDGFKESQVVGCVERAHLYQLSRKEAAAIVERQIDVIRGDWNEVCEQAELTETARNYFWKRQFLNDYALEGWPPAPVSYPPAPS
jgi:serine/threonine-protein kinase HipA